MPNAWRMTPRNRENPRDLPAGASGTGATSGGQLGADSAGGYTIVGHVTSGLQDLIDKVTSKGIAEVGADGLTGTPVVPTTITTVTLQ